MPWCCVVLATAACGTPSNQDAGIVVDAAVQIEDAGDVVDAGPTDAGHSIDAGPTLPRARIQASLFFSDAGLVDDVAVVSFAKLLQLISDDGHGGALLSAWFHRFATTAHSEARCQRSSSTSSHAFRALIPLDGT